MTYRLLADLVVMIHGLWIAFLLLGLLLVWQWRWLIPWHLAGVALVLVLNLGGWYCPLTHLEVYLRGLHHPSLTYPGSFMANYLERLIYLEVNQSHLRWASLLWAAGNLVGYLLLWRRTRLDAPKRSS